METSPPHHLLIIIPSFSQICQARPLLLPLLGSRTAPSLKPCARNLSIRSITYPKEGCLVCLDTLDRAIRLRHLERALESVDEEVVGGVQGQGCNCTGIAGAVQDGGGRAIVWGEGRGDPAQRADDHTHTCLPPATSLRGQHHLEGWGYGRV